ncbi:MULTISPECIES: MptD family putative ECF transporter S component [Terrabacteria group]|uniref:MptD family putative ECF transporter S component n=1 Tax=Bacillati TaxID=1783272 RepID=UPI001C6ED9B5|nr:MULTISPECIES: MptD family putative ECF transporter S component [Terrabacteria group]MBW9213068.1 MptD family putative ECF transporter S component [Trueperella sp. zg.1013]
MKNNLKTNDFLLIALLTAVYIIIYFVVMALITPLGAMGHAISPGICALFSGTVLYFMARKVGKLGQFTILTILVMACFSLMGGGYLPWIISSVLTAILADLLASLSKKTSVFRLAISSGIMHVGQAWGAIIPSLFFVDKYKEEWIRRGQTALEMEAYIKYTSGMWAWYSSIIVFMLAFVGIYLGYFILKKHLKGN